jgi:cell division protein ZapA
MDTEKSIRVQILNREYPLRVRPEDEHSTRTVAALVDERMQAIRAQVPGEPDLTVAVLAAMALAEEMTAHQREAALRESNVLGVINSLADHLKDALDEHQ